MTLSQIILKESTEIPDFIDPHFDMKSFSILSYQIYPAIRKCATNKFLTLKQIDALVIDIEIGLFHIKHQSSIYLQCKVFLYILDKIEQYEQLSLSNEEYEFTSNLTKLFNELLLKSKLYAV